jgi:hypothetical protein
VGAVVDSVALADLAVNKVATVASNRAMLPLKVDSQVATVAASPVTVVNRALLDSKVDLAVNRVDSLLNKVVTVHLRVATEGESPFFASLLFVVMWFGAPRCVSSRSLFVVGASAAGHRKRKNPFFSLAFLCRFCVQCSDLCFLSVFALLFCYLFFYGIVARTDTRLLPTTTRVATQPTIKAMAATRLYSSSFLGLLFFLSPASFFISFSASRWPSDSVNYMCVSRFLTPVGFETPS